MTAVNMCMHGCVGEAVCHDSLKPGDWRFGYLINPYLNKTGIPGIFPLKKEDSFIMAVRDNIRQNNVKHEIDAEEKANTQLNMFD